MARYMTTARFRALTIMPGPDLDEIETLEPGWTQTQLDLLAAWIDSRLAKRYVTPFGATPTAPPLRLEVPAIIEDWMTALLTPRAYGKRGVNPAGGELWFTEFVVNPATQAKADIKEAADAQNGLFDLPLKSSVDPSGAATRSGPLAYIETSPWVWTDVQREAAHDDDVNGSGTTS